ncbi:LacI family DNA-binding transcriptional regulator [Herbiconiux sp. P16]|uniref:LacI family DNA-binding transcriptional regulator n=1 Tax=Herbiconiux wuyangfengii TaxID=3342794 RepID=UPI0035B6B3C8
MPKPPTMKDVAAAAGVSLKTVSRHVNGATNIDPVLAGRIAAAIVALGYRHNLAAASIRPGRSAKVIGLVISDLANPYWSALARSVERVLSENGYLLMTVSSEEDAERHRLLVDRLIAQRVDGLIAAPPRRDGLDWAVSAAAALPLVAIDRPVVPAGAWPGHDEAAGGRTGGGRTGGGRTAGGKTGGGKTAGGRTGGGRTEGGRTEGGRTESGDAAEVGSIDELAVETVLADNAGGAEAATRELLAQGARRVLFLGDSLELYTMRERLEGYRRGMRDASRGASGDPSDDASRGASGDPSDGASGGASRGASRGAEVHDDDLVVTSAHTAAEAADIVGSLLGTGRADAVFAANNRSSIGAVEAFTRAGIRLPLIGYDDFESATLVRPAVSVVAQDVALMGETAARAVLARLSGTAVDPAVTVLPTQLILRGSEQAPRDPSESAL